MILALEGTDEDGNRYATVASVPFIQFTPHDSFSQPAIENIQLTDFLRQAQTSGFMADLASIEWVADDPPDVSLVMRDGQTFAVELTTISATEITRGRLDEAAKIESAIRDRIAAEPEAFAHLQGRIVALNELASDQNRPPKRKPIKFDKFVNQIVDELRTDFGVAGVPVDPDNPVLPEFIPAEVANVGRKWIEDNVYNLEVHRAEPPSGIHVTSNVQIELGYTDVANRVMELVDRKDKPANQILLITTGLMNKTGRTVPVDRLIFNMIYRLSQDGTIRIAPKHLNQVILHFWGEPHFLCLFKRPDAPDLLDTGKFTTHP